MMSFTRTATILPGKVSEGIGFAQRVANYVRKTNDLEIHVWMPIAGNPHRVAWRSEHASLAAYEAHHQRLYRDPAYLDLLGSASSLFIPGSVADEMWRSL